MRVPVLVLVLLLVAPVASAGFTWFVPDQAYAGQPVSAAYAFVEQEDPMTLTQHQNVALSFYQGDTLLVETSSVHEHDGFYSTMFTPPAAGEYRLVAETGDGKKEHLLQVKDSRTDPALQAAFETGRLVIEELPGGGHRLGLRLNDVESNATPHMLLDLRDETGMQVLSAWQDTRGHTDVTARFGAVAPTALATGPDHHVSADQAFGLRVLEPQRIEASDELDLSQPLGEAPIPRLPDGTSCQEAGLNLFVDPGSQSAARNAWQTDTDIRVAVLDLDVDLSGSDRVSGRISYDLEERNMQPDRIFAASTADAFGQLTFRLREPGNYQLQIMQGDAEKNCTFDFDIEDGPETGGGPSPAASMTTDITVDGRSAQLDLTVVQAGGDVTGHYEFDTRVYRANSDDADGALLWKGKLHGHASAVNLSLHHLAPGDYVVQVFPSPQDGSGSGVIAEGEDGFRSAFSITGGPDGEPVAEEAPGAGAMALAVALAAGLALRRRK